MFGVNSIKFSTPAEKARFIKQVRRGEVTTTDNDVSSELILTPEEIKAISGLRTWFLKQLAPKILEKLDHQAAMLLEPTSPR
ncbi:MAG: hypothetical protein HY072_01565 [Deltaproteobacteria bacterium]|nr:hypothetical protein [Deltaproteobacteria bacterium]